MIKKLLYGIVLVAGLVSCDDDYTDWANPQSNAAKDAVEKFDMTVQQGISSIDFATETATEVQLFTTNLEEGQTDEYTVIFSAADNDKTAELSVPSDGMVSVSDLENAVTTIYGRAPQERTLNVEVSAEVTITTEDGDVVAKKSAAPFTLKATPNAPYIAQNYYIIGEPSAWDPSNTTLQFNHSGNDVYDDPVFTITIPVEDKPDDNGNMDGNMWFAITDDISASTYQTSGGSDWSQVIGCAEGNGNNGTEGSVARRSEIGNDGSFCIPVDGSAKYIRITLNMLEYTYTIEKLNFNEFIYEIGNNNGWGNGYALHGPNFDGKYYGAMYLKSGFKFSIVSSGWDDAGNWGKNDNGDEGILVNSGSSKDISCTDGFYMITVDIANLTYKLTPFTWIGIIGDGQPGGWSTDTFMTYDETDKCWVANHVALTAGGKIKFRSDSNWAEGTVNYGGTLDELVYNGGDIPVTESGTYTVRLYLENKSGQPFATLEEE